ncbi:hypothetical protein Pcinc_033833 [Petrolisthes cinctipes]|uniref:Uncharacterized protein n=1 Tax=Petrolisthes cinctipes TaxID=88211 RepID=A0AAE1JYI6_PETCI|nr:hypothetical protein Pcinc_033833 [Petrolisthes cinctipes]
MSTTRSSGVAGEIHSFDFDHGSQRDGTRGVDVGLESPAPPPGPKTGCVQVAREAGTSMLPLTLGQDGGGRDGSGWSACSLAERRASHSLAELNSRLTGCWLPSWREGSLLLLLLLLLPVFACTTDTS